ncbi:LysE family translocator [Stappia sediminis]|uniref:LysE family translocator n=1 Tax=Stappia sediminis TaxID=2692190 RepID=UPI001AD8FA89|nr:LysE family translocator [Stappia sediminis]
MSDVQTYLPGILLALGAMGVSLLSPGPNILAVIGTSMSTGRASGRALAAGIASGSFLWSLLAWSGFTAVLTLYASVLTVIKVAGAFYLLWLAVKSFRSAASAHDIEAKSLDLAGGPSKYYLRGLTIQMTNPKAALAWIAIMSLGMQAGAPLWVGLSIVAGTTIMSFAGHMIYAVAFSTRPVVNVYIRARRWIQAGLGAFFCFASYKLLTSKI